MPFGGIGIDCSVKDFCAWRRVETLAGSKDRCRTAEQCGMLCQKYGNTTATTIPLAMYKAEEQDRLKKGDLLMTVAFGSGFIWGANLIRW